VNFLSMIENLTVTPGAPAARIVVNSRTGTVVINRAVRVETAAVTHGTISVRVTATNEASQPNAFGQGETQQVQNAEISVQDDPKQMVLFETGIDLRDLVEAVNQVGASPSSLIAILEALKRSGSLKAELVVI
jgi:flagellar P-ring protein FlgI